MKFYIYGLIIFALSNTVGCATMMGSSIPGGVSVKKNDYDNSKEVVMAPGWANNDMSGSMKIGARKTSKMGADEVILVVQNDMIKNFDFNHPNFFMMLDGKEMKLSPTEKSSQCGVSTAANVANCTQEYRVSIGDIEKMVSLKDVKFKLNLSGNSFVEGSLNNSGMTTARSGLQDFLTSVKTEFVNR